MKKNRIKESQLFIEEWHDTCLALPDYEDVWFIVDNRLCVGKYEPNQQMFCMADGMGVELRYVRQWKYVGINKQIAVFPKEKQIIAIQTPEYPCLITGIFTDHCIDEATGDEVSAVITDDTIYNCEEIIDWKRVSYWFALPEMPIVVLDPVGDAITIAIPDTEEVIVDRTGVTDEDLQDTTSDLCNCEGNACECVGPMSMDSEEVKSAIANSNTLSEKCLKEGLEDEDTTESTVEEDLDIYDIDAPEPSTQEVSEESEEEPHEEDEENSIEEDSELQNSVKDWYTVSFEVDNLSEEISAEVTFRDIMDCLEEHRDFYDCIGVADSVIRERVFQKLAEILNVEPMVVYYQWLKDDYDWYADVEEEDTTIEVEKEEEPPVEEIDSELKEEYDTLNEPISLDNLPKDLAESTMKYFCNILKEY